jgi:threonine/homoserine/homoserine lactone efflux protein
MNALDLLLKGVLAGFAISAPVGPVNVLCFSRTLSKGRMAGLISGLGAATADTIYGGIAGFSISFIIIFLLHEEFWIRLFGGMLLIAIGIRYYFKKPQSLEDENRNRSTHSDFVSALLLNLTNPTTVLSFLAVLAALGMGQHKSWWLKLLLVAGIFCGAMLWMNRIAGLAIGGFGIVTLALSHWSHK